MAAMQAAVEWKHRVTREKAMYGSTAGTTSASSSLPLSVLSVEEKEGQ